MLKTLELSYCKFIFPFLHLMLKTSGLNQIISGNLEMECGPNTCCCIVESKNDLGNCLSFRKVGISSLREVCN